MFYRWLISDPSHGGFVALSGGYEHESNGKDDEDSRSIDTLFLKAEGRYYLDDGVTYFGLEPKVWTYLDREDNPDIARYRGYAELGLRYGRDDGLMLTSLLRRGTAGKMRRQFDLSWPLRRSVFSGVGAFLHLQYVGGYGETLLDYNRDDGGQWRIGISLVR
ncbi:phospholipase A [Thauera sp.]|uniref:phospholipase A n=1 Tax=Thauera sp. TaxID=1905334 RepID=UPI0039E59FFF